MTHTNFKIGFTPRARNIENRQSSIVNYAAGQSLVWMATPKINPLVDVLIFRNSEKFQAEKRQYSNELFVGPGVRWVHSINDGFRLVPSISVPFGIGPSRGNYSIVFGLSFQHRFKKARE
jgi:hypothetical protein